MKIKFATLICALALLTVCGIALLPIMRGLNINRETGECAEIVHFTRLVTLYGQEVANKGHLSTLQTQLESYAASMGGSGSGFNTKGAYSAGTTYAAHDAVTYNGSLYVSLIDANTGNTPSSSPSAWVLTVSKGDTGSTGAQGPPGADGAAGSQGPTGLTGPTGPTGSAGSNGVKGDKGDIFTVSASGLLSGKSAYDTEAQGFSYLATDTGNLYIKNSATSGDWSAPIAFQGPQGPAGATGAQGPQGTAGTNGSNGTNGTNGVNAYVYIAYASDASGTGWSLTPSSSLKYRAEIHSTTALTPVKSDFSSATWVKFIGDNGATGATGAVGLTGAKGDTGNVSLGIAETLNISAGTRSVTPSGNTRTIIIAQSTGSAGNQDEPLMLNAASGQAIIKTWTLTSDFNTGNSITVLDDNNSESATISQIASTVDVIDLYDDAASGQAVIHLLNTGHTIIPGEVLSIWDNANSETRTVSTVSQHTSPDYQIVTFTANLAHAYALSRNAYVQNVYGYYTVTMSANLTHSYTTAANAKLRKVLTGTVTYDTIDTIGTDNISNGDLLAVYPASGQTIKLTTAGNISTAISALPSTGTILQRIGTAWKVISAGVTTGGVTYTAGTGISIANGVISATGGGGGETIGTIASITSSGNWTVPAGVTVLKDVWIIAGGGSGSVDHGAGGGAGGVKHLTNYAVTPAASIAAVIGAGGVWPGSGLGVNGGNSSFDGKIAIGGGGAGGGVESAGGSGGGGSYQRTYTGGVGVGGQGWQGGNFGQPYYAGGGGGGFSSAGMSRGTYMRADGGDGIDLSAYVGTSIGDGGCFAGGGGGGVYNPSDNLQHGRGGKGGGGDGGHTADTGKGYNGIANTGGGGGGSSIPGSANGGGNGGSGIIIIRY